MELSFRHAQIVADIKNMVCGCVTLIKHFHEAGTINLHKVFNCQRTIVLRQFCVRRDNHNSGSKLLVRMAEIKTDVRLGVFPYFECLHGHYYSKVWFVLPLPENGIELFNR